MSLRQSPTPAETLRLGYHTARRMQLRQLAGITARKTREQLVARLPLDFDRWYERQLPAELSVDVSPLAANTAVLRESLDRPTRKRYRERAEQAAAGTPTFFNRTLRIAQGTTVDWFDDRLDEQPAIWRLKLYAFEPLEWLCLGFNPGNSSLQPTFDGWVSDWEASVTIGPGYLRRTWTPWAVSLRVLRWCRYLAWRAGSPDGSGDQTLHRQLYRNALFLENHVEWDVGGNHLVENGTALVAAGVCFDEQRWIDAGVGVLRHVAATQFLDDGCHFERSPMYHVVVLTRYLTACDLLERSGRRPPGELCATAERAAAFLRHLRPPDGHIPLLNDAVYGQALSLESCLRYADAVGFDSPNGGHLDADGRLPASGYCWLPTAAGTMLVDGGAVGPPHLPGHSHSDTLSVLLWLGGRRVVTDTGTFGYVSGPRRQYARGVRGHNTVQVGDLEPIAIGGAYLMGRRAEPTARYEPGPISLFEGRYEVHPARGQRYSHHRAVYAGDSWWLLRDTLRGHPARPVRGRLHLHPDAEASLEPTGRTRVDVGDATAFVSPLEGGEITVTTGPYFPAFGVETSRRVLEHHAAESGSPTTLSCLVSPREPAVSLEIGPDGQPSSLRLDDETRRLPTLRLDTNA